MKPFIAKIVFFFLIFSKVFSSDTYLSTNTFREMADFIIDPSTSFDPKMVKDGDIIFVESSILYFFAQYQQSKILKKYVLITHGHDQSIPGQYSYMLNDPNLIAWFAQNVNEFSHPKLFPIPIGIGRHLESKGMLKHLDRVRATAKKKNLEHLLYVNFCIGTNTIKRSEVYDILKNKDYSYISGHKNFELYLKDLASSKFIASPIGGGIDCYRTWESLYIAEGHILAGSLGGIPIVDFSDLNPLFEDLPVIVVKDWNEVTKEFLDQKFEELKTKKFNFEKLHAKYWRDLIFSKRAAYRN